MLYSRDHVLGLQSTRTPQRNLRLICGKGENFPDFRFNINTNDAKELVCAGKHTVVAVTSKNLPL